MKKKRKCKTEKEEAEFWATHDSADYIEGTKEAKVKFTRPKKNLVSVRLDDRTINELKKIAAARNISVTALIRQGVDALIRTGGLIDVEEKRKRALAIVGRFRSGNRDTSRGHDKYLAEAFGK